VRLLALLLFCACAQERPPPGAAGPVEAVQQFAEAVRKGDTATAWSLLSERTRAEADRLATLARAATDAGPASGRQMLFTSALPGRDFLARQVSLSGEVAEVQTTADGGTRIYRVVREGGRWRIDLDLGR
jgi:hypothetical protein